MARLNFTARGIEAISPLGKRIEYWDENLPGFGVRVSNNGRKSWFVWYRFHGRPRRLTLGTFPAVGLADARELAKTALLEIAQDNDPGTRKIQSRNAETVKELAIEYIERYAKLRKKSWRKDEGILKRDVIPMIGNLKTKEVGRRDVIAILDRIVDRGAPILANRTLEVIRKMFNFGVERELVEYNPCYLISKPSKSVSRERILSENEIRILWEILNKEVVEVAAIFKLLLLTGQRIGEVLKARWEDIDLEGGWWTIPKEHSKNDKSHRVPLCSISINVIRVLIQKKVQVQWLFPSPDLTTHRRYMCRAIRNIRYKCGFDFVPHDIRRTVASSLASLGVQRTVLRKILNHVERDVTSTYDRYAYDREKRDALLKWEYTLNHIVCRGELANKSI